MSVQPPTSTVNEEVNNVELNTGMIEANGDVDHHLPGAADPEDVGVIFEITSEDSGNEDDISDSIKQDVEINA